MSKLRDNHTHFTGSLPVEFVWDLMRKRKLPLLQHAPTWKKIFNDLDYEKCLNMEGLRATEYFYAFSARLSHMFKPDPKYNLNLFFEAYSLIQHWTKSTKLEEMEDLFIKGVEAISENFHTDGVDDFEIIAGPLIDWPMTQLRINSMITGFKNANKKYNANKLGGIRLTFIRDKNGSYFNYSFPILKNILDMANSNPDWERYVVGFDFSGIELAANFDSQIQILKILNDFNESRAKKSKRKLLVSVHAAEDLINNKPSDFFSYFDELLKMDFDRIGHGTFLWIPAKYLHLTNAETKQRSALLEQIANKKVEIEICPTANVVMSPLLTYAEIPLAALEKMNVSYTINTDNSLILSTSLRQEYRAIKLLK